MAHKSLIVFWLISLIPCSTADSQSAPFYQDKTIRIVAGTTTGGTYDRWARMFARTMPKYIPGNPNIVVQMSKRANSVVIKCAYLIPYVACTRLINPLSSSLRTIRSSISSSTLMVSSLGLRGLSRRCVLRRPSMDGESFLSSPVTRS